MATKTRSSSKSGRSRRTIQSSAKTGKIKPAAARKAAKKVSRKKG